MVLPSEGCGPNGCTQVSTVTSWEGPGRGAEAGRQAKGRAAGPSTAGWEGGIHCRESPGLPCLTHLMQVVEAPGEEKASFSTGLPSALFFRGWASGAGPQSLPRGSGLLPIYRSRLVGRHEALGTRGCKLGSCFQKQHEALAAAAALLRTHGGAASCWDAVSCNCLITE